MTWIWPGRWRTASGLEFVAQPILWDAKDMELDNGTIDCVWNGFTITGREDQYTWTEPYMNNEQVFVVLADSGITDTAGLAGKVVEVQVDSAAETALNGMPDLKATLASVETTPITTRPSWTWRWAPWMRWPWTAWWLSTS